MIMGQRASKSNFGKQFTFKSLTVKNEIRNKEKISTAESQPHKGHNRAIWAKRRSLDERKSCRNKVKYEKLN